MFGFITPAPATPYSPLVPTSFTVPTTITLPEGGTTAMPQVGSVTQLLAADSNPRTYLIMNLCPSNCFLFFGGVATTWESDIRSPFQAIPGGIFWVSEGFARMSVFGWSATGGDIIAGVFA